LASRAELMYFSLRIEAKISYYVEKFRNSYEFILKKTRQTPKPKLVWMESKELLEEALAKLNVISSYLKKYRNSMLPHYIQDSINLLESLRYNLETKTALPQIKKVLRMAIDDLVLDLRKILK